MIKTKRTRIQALIILWLVFGWWRYLLLIVCTISLPFIKDIQNPAGADPFILLLGICSLGWIGIILWIISILINPTETSYWLLIGET